MVVISNDSSVAPDCQETVGRMVTPVVETGAVPPTPGLTMRYCCLPVMYA